MSTAISTDDVIEFSLPDRLRNLSLAPGYYNCIVPLIEAVANSIHAIEDQFGADLKKGRIDIYPIYDDAKLTGFSVVDNGVGLTDKNYESFRKADSPHKAARGGKGVGRLTWLKAFEHIHVRSTYAGAPGSQVLEFDFSANHSPPIYNRTRSVVDNTTPSGTVVTLHPYQQSYEIKAPRREDGIAREIVRHFIPYIIDPEGPQIYFHGGKVEGDLRVLYASKISRHQEDEFCIKLEDGSVVDLRVKHLLVGKALKDAEANSFNTLFLCADSRPIKRYALDSAIGLAAIDDDYIYVGLVMSPTLDASANQERTSFSLDGSDIDQIQSAALWASKIFLAPYISEVRAAQIDLTNQVVEDNPRFMIVANDVGAFVETRLKLSQSKGEDIYLELARQHYRLQDRVRRDFQDVARAGKVGEAYDEAEKKYMSFVTKDTAHTLAEYVVRRRAVIAALENSRRLETSSTPSREFEEAIHNFICPLRSTTDDLHYDDHNLWILDDRLAFYTYFHSDRQLRQITTASDSQDEPDITFFDLGLGFRRGAETKAPIVLVEFKRPSRTNYHGEDPIRQMMRYIRKLREGEFALDKDGAELSEINKESMFHGIIVADLNNQLHEALEATFVKRRTPDGLGVFGYDEETKTFIEVVPYNKLLRDAKARNEAFFTKLGLKS